MKTPDLFQRRSSTAAATRPTALGIRRAACWVEDAINGRFESGMALLLDEPRWKQVCFAWNVSEAWESFLLLSCGALMLSTQWEPAKSVTLRDAAQAMAAAPEGWPLLAGQAAVILCFWIDVALKLAYMGWRKWWTKKWQRVYFATIVLLTVDVVAGAAAGQRPFRWLRPLLLLLRNREQRRIATALLHLLRVQLGAALAFATLLLVFVGAVCVHLYRPVYAAEAAASGGRNAFDNVLTAALELWVLVSSCENFPSLMLPAIERSVGGDLGSIAFFGPLLYLGYFFLMSVLLAVVVDEFLHSARRLVHAEEHKERRGLLKAFAALDPGCSGYASLATWCRLLTQLRPHITRAECELRFHMMRPARPALGLHVVEFLHVHHNLSIRLEPAGRARAWLPRMPRALRSLALLANGAAFCYSWPGMPPAEQRVCLGIHVAALAVVAFDANSWLATRRTLSAVAVGTAAAAAFVRFVVLGGALEAAAEAAEGPEWAARAEGWAEWATAWVGPAALSLLLLEATRGLRLIWKLLGCVLPQFGAVTVSAALFTYAWAVVGMQLFSEEEVAYAGAATEHFECAEPFASPGCCGLLLFQVMAGEDWDELLHGMREAAGWRGLLYVLGFFVVVNICLISLMVALAINAFLAAKADFIEQGLLVDDTGAKGGGGRRGSAAGADDAKGGGPPGMTRTHSQLRIGDAGSSRFEKELRDAEKVVRAGEARPERSSFSTRWKVKGSRKRSALQPAPGVLCPSPEARRAGAAAPSATPAADTDAAPLLAAAAPRSDGAAPKPLPKLAGVVQTVIGGKKVGWGSNALPILRRTHAADELEGRGSGGDEGASAGLTRWQIVQKTSSAEWRRKAAGLTGAEEPFTEEESRIIALQTANSFSAAEHERRSHAVSTGNLSIQRHGSSQQILMASTESPGSSAPASPEPRRKAGGEPSTTPPRSTTTPPRTRKSAGGNGATPGSPSQGRSASSGSAKWAKRGGSAYDA